jgi:signal transduction histidine kinase
MSIPASREIFKSDIRQTIRAAWLVISLSIIISILALPGGIKNWQLQATAIILLAAGIALVLDHKYKTLWPFVIMPIVHLTLPIIYGNSSSESWIAYGFITISSIIHITAFDSFRISLAIIYFVALLQYIVAKLDFSSISDNADNLLLSSYFGTLWCVVIGLGALIIRHAYLKYYDAIEKYALKVNELTLVQASQLSQLNMKDHINSKLHGTVLNTLIASRTSPNLLSNPKEISRYLRAEMESIDAEINEAKFDLERFIVEELNNPYQRDMKIDVESDVDLDEFRVVHELVKEIIRELVLNAKKHSQATACKIEISISTKSISEEFESSILERELSIIFSDNSPHMGEQQNLANREPFSSESLARIVKSVNGEISQESNGETLVQRVSFVIPEDASVYLQHILTLRRESIKFIGKGYALLTLIYAISTFPGYLYLSVDNKVAALFALQILLTASSFLFKRFAIPLAGLGSLVSISIFPLLSTQELACQEIQYLPWIFNSIIGSAFFVTLLIRNKVLKWLPLGLFFISSLIVADKLPNECSSLLDGSIPGIILIAVVAVGLSVAKKVRARDELRFISLSNSSLATLESTQKLVISERGQVLNQIRRFTNALIVKSFESDKLLREISSQIISVHNFLLASEYFDSNFVYELYIFSKFRNSQDRTTILEINCNDFGLSLSKNAIESLFNRVEGTISETPVKISVIRDQDLLVEVSSLNEEGLRPKIFQNGNLKIVIVGES